MNQDVSKYCHAPEQITHSPIGFAISVGSFWINDKYCLPNG